MKRCRSSLSPSPDLSLQDSAASGPGVRTTAAEISADVCRWIPGRDCGNDRARYPGIFPTSFFHFPRRTMYRFVLGGRQPCLRRLVSGNLWGQPPAWVFRISLTLGLSIDCGTSQISLKSAVRWPDCHKSFTLKRRPLQNFPFSVIFRPARGFLATLGMTICRNDRMQRSRKRVDHG